MYNPQVQKQWDKNLKDGSFIEITPGKKSYGITYTINKKQFQFCSRDFYEKGFGFYHDGKFYRYSSSIDNSENPGPNGEPPMCAIKDPHSQVRGYTIFNVGLMDRDS